MSGLAITLLTAVPLAGEGLNLSLQGASGSAAVKLVALLTLLSVAPALLLTLTCFTRFVIVFAFARQALGVQGAPPTMVLTGLALFMTFFVMKPTLTSVYAEGVNPYMEGHVSELQALDRGSQPLRKFMLKQAREEDIALFIDAAGDSRPNTPEDVSMITLIPAFVTSELHAAFQMGFLVLVPFLLIDLLVASVLMSLGMAMVSPVLVSLPIKVLVFVLADGWTLLIGSLLRSVA